MVTFLWYKEFIRIFYSCIDNCGYNAINGYNGMFLTYFKASLGLISEQILQRGWIFI